MYFGQSQLVKKQIENSPLVDVIRNHFDNKTLALFIGGGTTNNHYSIGKLESGLFVTLRVMKFVEHNPGEGFHYSILDEYESYCEVAEEYHAQGKRVTNFCIGISYNMMTALLVEDFSQGKRKVITHDPLDETAQVDNEMVYLELEKQVQMHFDYKYMSDNARIKL